MRPYYSLKNLWIVNLKRWESNSAPLLVYYCIYDLHIYICTHCKFCIAFPCLKGHRMHEHWTLFTPVTSRPVYFKPAYVKYFIFGWTPCQLKLKSATYFCCNIEMCITCVICTINPQIQSVLLFPQNRMNSCGSGFSPKLLKCSQLCHSHFKKSLDLNILVQRRVLKCNFSNWSVQ